MSALRFTMAAGMVLASAAVWRAAAEDSAARGPREEPQQGVGQTTPKRVLQLQAEWHRTTADLIEAKAAQKLDEKPTRLYHHVEALERVGLIRLTRTQQNRGTVEKYFRAVARTFRADPSLFSTEGEPGKADTLAEMVSTMMTRTSGELEQLVRAGHDISSGEEALVSFTEVRADDEGAEKIRKKLMRVLKEIEALGCDQAPREGLRRYRFNLAYFPLDLSEQPEKD